MTSLPVWNTPVARRPGWERAFVETLQRHVDQPFDWGKSDCLIVPADLCEAMTGRNPFPAKLRQYSTELGAAKLLHRLGFVTVEDALSAVFPRLADSAQARRGDCGVIASMLDGRTQLACVIILHDGTAVGKGPDGNIRVAVSRLKSLFAIG